MIKKIFPVLSMAAVLAAMTGCSEEQTLPVGEGKIYLSTRVNTDVKVESRSELEDELGATTKVWISNSEGVVRKYDGIDAIPADGIKLLSGEYTVKAWAGTAAYASFTDRWFEGSETFTVSSGSSASVEVTCKIANVVASLKLAEGVDELLTDPSLTVSHKGGSLTFAGETAANKGYFLMPEGVTTLDYVFTATTAEGTPVEKRGTIADVLPAHEYVLNVVADKSIADPSGAGFITIEIDESMVEVKDDITITTPPSITGYGFDLSVPVAGESGSVGRRSVYVCAASALTSVRLSGLEGIDDFGFILSSPDILEEVARKGISCEKTDVDEGQMMKIIFDDIYLNSLPNRDEAYVFTITATDTSNKTTTAKLTLKISEAPVITNPVKEEDITFNSLTLESQVAKDNVETVGFEYRVNDAADWTYAAGSTASRAAFAKGQIYTATITGLPYDSKIEYRAVSGPADNPTDFRGDIMTAAMKPTPQLPNSDMETWGTTTYHSSKGPIVPTNNYAEPWTWDCGNHGSITMNKNVTDKSSEKKHGGNYSAKLVSQFVGIGSAGKHACGNIVFGHYLKTDVTDGIFGFGNKFDFQGLRPTALKLWVHYTPAAADKGTGSHMSKGDMDIANIFVAIFDGPDMADKDYPGQVGYVVRTKKSSARYFDRNAANLVGFGDTDIVSATAGSDMVELTIPITYKNTTANLWGIAVVCAASKYGDYYEGGEGSTLYVDDFKLVY